MWTDSARLLTIFDNLSTKKLKLHFSFPNTFVSLTRTPHSQRSEAGSQLFLSVASGHGWPSNFLGDETFMLFCFVLLGESGLERGQGEGILLPCHLSGSLCVPCLTF